MTVERGQVQAKEFSKNGKPKIKINGAWYFAGRCDISGINPGTTIEFEWNEFGEERNGRRPRGLQNWAPIGTPAPTHPPTNGHAPPSSALDDADRPFISNIVAHAIAAGLVKDPTELEKWAVAAQGAMRALKGEKPAPRVSASSAPPQRLSTDYDQSMPEGFYADSPPPEEPPRGTRTW